MSGLQCFLPSKFVFVMQEMPLAIFYSEQCYFLRYSNGKVLILVRMYLGWLLCLGKGVFFLLVLGKKGKIRFSAFTFVLVQ